MRLKMICRRIVLPLLFVPLLPSFGQTAQTTPPGKKLSPEEMRLLKEANELTGLAIKLNGQQKFAEAEVPARQALETRLKILGENHIAVEQAFYNLGVIYQGAGRLQDAELHHKRCLKIRETRAGSDELLVAHSLYSLGMVYQAMSRFKDAELHLQRGLQIRESKFGENHLDVAACVGSLGIIYLTTGRYQQADMCLQRSLRILEERLGKDHPALGNVLYDLTRLRRAQGRYHEALVFARRCLQIREAEFGPEHPFVANFVHNLAIISADLGLFQEAEALHQRALKIREARLGPEHSLVAQSLNDLALVYAEVRRYKEAEALLQRCLKIRETALVKNPNDVVALRSKAANLGNLAHLYQKTKRLAEAEQFLRRSLALYEAIAAKSPNEAGTHANIAIIMNNLAVLLDALGRFEEANALYRRTLERQKKIPGAEHPSTATTMYNFAEFLMYQGQYQDADILLRDVRTIYETKLGPSHPSVARCLLLQAALQQAMGHTKQALALQEQGMSLQEANLRKILMVSSERDMFAALEESNGHTSQIMTMALSGDREGLIAALTWSLRRQGMVFDMLFRFRQAQSLLSPSDPLTMRANRYREVQRLLANTALTRPKDVSAEQLHQQRQIWQKEADELQAELNRALAQRFPEQIGSDTAIETANIQQCLPAGSAFIMYAKFGPYNFKATGKARRWQAQRYFAFVVTPDANRPRLIDLGPASIIDKAVEALRREFDNGQRLDINTEEVGEEEYRATAKALYQLVFAKLRPALGKANLIYLVPHGDLARVPFEALVDEKSNYLIESFRFAYQSAGRDLLRSKPLHPGKGTVVFAGPDFDMTVAQRQEKVKGLDGAASKDSHGREPLALRDLRSGRWRELKGAAAEADDVRKALDKSSFGPVKVFSGTDALEEIFKQVKSPQFLHVATHGFFLPDAVSAEAQESEEPDAGFGAARGMSRLRQHDNPLLRCGLILAGANILADGEKMDVDDGWVTAAEIALMDLRGTELVVLSACETGLGKEVSFSESSYGLRRAFLYSGARTLLTSLFAVPDAQTRDLMKQFYTNLQKGQGKLAALHNAQIQMIRQRQQLSGGAAHPFFWASFVLVGDPE